MNWIIYVLKNPRTSEVRYVGWTSKSANRRLNTHIQEAVSKPRRSYRANWILSMLSIGIRPVIEVVERGSGDGWAAAERRWIANFRANGAPLVNGTDGGDGTPGLRRTPEQAARRLPPKGNTTPRSPETLARMADSQRGKKLSADHRAAISHGLLRAYVSGKRLRPSAEARAKRSRAMTGIEFSAETRERMSKAAKLRKATPQTRERMSLARRLFIQRNGGRA